MTRPANFTYEDLKAQVQDNVELNSGVYTLCRYLGESSPAHSYILSPAVDRIFDGVFGPTNSFSINLTTPIPEGTFLPKVPAGVDANKIQNFFGPVAGRRPVEGNPVYDDEHKSVGIFGVGESLFARNMAVLLILSCSVHNDGDPVVQVYLQATPLGDDPHWSLADSFSTLATSGFVASLEYEQSPSSMPKLSLCTYMTSMQVPAALYFQGKALLETLIGTSKISPQTVHGVERLLSGNRAEAETDAAPGQPIEGVITFEKGLPLFELHPSVSQKPPFGEFGPFRISMPLLSLISRPQKGLTGNYISVGSGQLSVLLAVAGKNRDIVLPLRCSISDLRVAIPFRLNLSALIESFTISPDEAKGLLDGADSTDFDQSAAGSLSLAEQQVPLAFTVAIAPEAPTEEDLVKYLSLSVENPAPWTIISTDTTTLAVDTFRITGTLFSPFVAAARYFTIALMAEVQLGEGTFRFSFDPAQETVFLSECSGRVTLENLVSLLMGGGEVDVPDIAITDFSLAIDAKNSFYKGSLILNSDWNFQLGDVTFGIQNLVAKMSYNTVLGSRFFLYGSMDFSGIIDEKSEDGSENSSELIMMAAYPGQQAGWTFMGKGKSGCDTIGDIVDQVVELFGGVPDPLPAVIQNLAVTEVEVRFNTKTRAAAFIVEAAWLSEEDVSSATVRLEIKNRVQAAGTSQVIFSGQLVFDDDEGNAEFEFDLIFETAGDQDLFLAYYQSDEASQTTLSNLVSQITGQSPDDPSGASLVEISLLEGLFCYDNRSGNGKELFCVGLGAALDLSELGELPIIGPLFDDAPDLDIVTQLLYATGAENSSGIVFTQPEVALLNRLLMGKKVQFPQADENGIPAGLSTAMLIRLGGGKPIPVDLYPPTATGLPPNVSGMPRPESITPRSQERISWFRIQKTFGPINISRVGLGFSENGITGYLDANLNADVFQAGLIELYVTFELRDTGFDNIEFGLNGLSLEFQIEPLSIGGTFLKSESSDSSAIQYDGFASIQTGPLMLSALGSYTSDETGHPSLFLFAVADFPLGGPGFCFLTGFCAGFGFNRDLILPPVSGVPTYWMIQEATKPRGNFYGGSTRRLNSIALSANRYCPAATGQYWLAAGVSFTSYEIVNSLAVLSVGVGNGSLEFDVIGMSTILVPPTPGENFTPIGQAQLALEGSFTLQEDPFSADIVIQGQLTQNSYIFSRSCRLTGGFALAFWVGGNQGGDFVATFGGYHPDFKPPSYYPRVPRVGFHWMIGRLLNAKGNMYFALTPHAIMAGGLLELLCQISASGPVPSFRASFELSVDFLLNWKPYHYQAETVAEVDISVVFKSFGTHTISASAGADLDLWGPDFGGTAELHMSILFIKINFDVSFGAANEPPQPSSFGDFQNSFLPPQEEPPNSVNLPQTTTPAPTAEQDASSSGNAHWNYISAIVTSGLSRQIQVSQDGETRNYSIVNAKHLAITTSSVIPVTQFESWTEVDLSSFQTGGLGIAPMNQTIDSASHTLSVERRTDSGDDAGTFTDTSSQFAPPQPYPKAVPTAMWNTQMLDTSDPASVNAQQLFKNTVGGALIQPQSPVAPGESRAFPRKRFRYDTTDLAEAFAWERTGRFLVDTENNPAPDDLDANVKALHSLQETLNSGPVVAARNQLLATLGFVTNKVNLNQPILEYTTLAPRYGTFESLESKPT